MKTLFVDDLKFFLSDEACNYFKKDDDCIKRKDEGIYIAANAESVKCIVCCLRGYDFSLSKIQDGMLRSKVELDINRLLTATGKEMCMKNNIPESNTATIDQPKNNQSGGFDDGEDLMKMLKEGINKNDLQTLNDISTNMRIGEYIKKFNENQYNTEETENMTEVDLSAMENDQQGGSITGDMLSGIIGKYNKNAMKNEEENNADDFADGNELMEQLKQKLQTGGIREMNEISSNFDISKYIQKYNENQIEEETENMTTVDLSEMDTVDDEMYQMEENSISSSRAKNRYIDL